MDRCLIRIISLSKSIAQILVEVLGDEGRDRSHQLGGDHDNIKENAERRLLVLYSRVIALHA